MKDAILTIKVFISTLTEQVELEADVNKKYWLKQKLKHARTALTNLEKAIRGFSLV